MSAPDLKNSRRPSSDTASPPRVDRLPPYSLEAEVGALGCILLSPFDCIDECVTRFQGHEVFYDLRHQELWMTLVDMREEKIAIDLITIQHRLRERGVLDHVGGIAYISTLPDGVPSAANLSYYNDILWDKYCLRRLINSCTHITGQAYDGAETEQVDQLVDEAERSILSVGRARIGVMKTNSTKALVDRAITRIEELHANGGMMTGVPSGFRDLDALTFGFQPGNMIVIAARPSVGKTALALNIAEHVALTLNRPVGVFSLEMTADELMLRLVCSRARVNLRDIRNGILAERDFAKLTAATSKIRPAPLYIDDSSGISILELKAKARRMHQQHKIELLIIDYLQLLHSKTRRANDSRQQEIAEISSGIKELAKELKIPIVILAQLNRELEKRGDGAKPRMSDLRESGSIEQDADLVALLYRPNQAEEGQEETQAQMDSQMVSLFLAKQRNGPTGDVDLTFLKGYTRFESVARVSAADVPHDA